MAALLYSIQYSQALQKEISSKRDTMHRLDKLGTHLKYFSQKQDSILVRNELTSAQHRWDKLLSRSAERTRHLDVGYKEAKRFAESWGHLVQWLDDQEAKFDAEPPIGSDSDKIKQLLHKHKDFQRALGAKQPALDLVIRRGKMLKDKAPKSDSPILQEMINQLKTKWNALCGRSVDKQRSLEEALLYSGQFKDALQALLDWLTRVEPQLGEQQRLHMFIGRFVRGDHEPHRRHARPHRGECREQERLVGRPGRAGHHRGTGDVQQRSQVVRVRVGE